MSLRSAILSHPWRAAAAVLATVFLLISVLGTRHSDAPKYLTAPVTRTDLIVSISATGVVEPEEVVDVGAQVAGQIRAFGNDTKGKVVDYGSEVEEGSILAWIDDSLYAADVAQAQATLKKAQASAEEARARLKLSEADWNRRKGLRNTPAIASSEIDAYAANYEVARANVGLAEADIAVAQSAVQRAERNLGYTTIRSPVRGVIVDRRVNIGQTVVSSLNAPSLFLIARDLGKVEVWAAVNEADIANILVGQKATFTVDAYPNESFSGTVRRVRLNASMNQNVVTYIVEVAADNTAGKLLPYLTASVEFEVRRKPNALVVPNTALRWAPTAEVAKQARETSEENIADDQGTVWVADGSEIKPVTVTLGDTNGKETEIAGGELAEGAKVVVGQSEIEKGGQDMVNPFAPKVMRGGRR